MKFTATNFNKHILDIMMIKEVLRRILLVVVLFLLCIKTSSESAPGNATMTVQNRCIDRERQALLVFKRGLVDKHGLLSSWGSEEENRECCRWRGIQCDNRTGHVTQLHLSSYNYYYPFRLASNIISSSLLELQNLNFLDLSYNNFEGMVIPKFICSLTKLVHLNLSFANFSGAIPSELGNLSNLHHLDLSSNNFRGAIPYQLGNLSNLHHLDLSSTYLISLLGPIPHQLSNLTAIRYLALRGNQLDGDISKSFINLCNLQNIDLSFNNFIGNLPNFLCACAEKTLQTVVLSGNQLTGSLPDITRLSSLRELRVDRNELNGYFPNRFEHHSALEILDLFQNQLKGYLPDFTGFSSLGTLDLADNELNGSLPDFTGCSSMAYLQLSGNQLTKWETQSIGQLSKLHSLDLSNNSFGSVISEVHLSNLSNLEYLRLSFNSLTLNFSSEWLPPFKLRLIDLSSCKLGPKFPNWIRNQREIIFLIFSSSQISDTIPMWFWNLSKGMIHLNLSSNKIEGKLPSTFTSFQAIDLSSNSLDGPIPLFPSKCSLINLSRNKFSGTLSFSSIGGNMDLSVLDLSHNLLYGELPDRWMYFKELGFLNLGYNNLSGTIPTSIGSLFSLQTLILRKNKFSGKLPMSLRNCSSLGFLDVGLNKFSGNVPAWIGEDLSKLYALILRDNKFSGSIPHQLCRLSALHFLDLSINSIYGTIPPCVHDLTALVQKGIESSEHHYGYIHSLMAPDTFVDNALAGWKGRDMEYGRNFAYLKMIDLSTNKLTGEIPKAITRLLELKGLNLSRNKFYGKVPQEIGQLKMLESLDLSTNQFSGRIPTGMSELHFLGYLNLSNNNFSGKIPSGTQLQGFNASVYDGNDELCGPPLTRICREDETPRVWPLPSVDKDAQDENEYERWFYISAALGFSTAFWVVCGTLLLNRRWRHAYFLFLENLKDRLYVTMLVRFAHLRRKF